MKFEVEIPDDKMDAMIKFLKTYFDYDENELTPELAVRDCFWVEDRHGMDFDIREDIKVKQIEVDN